MPEPFTSEPICEILKNIQQRVSLLWEDMTAIKARLTSIDTRLGLVHTGMALLSDGMDRPESRMEQVETRLNLAGPAHPM